LALRGVGARHQFWRTIYGDSELELPFKLNLLRRFRNLKRLSLRDCHDAVDDDIIHFIVREMTSLEEFEISYCIKLTNAGIAGTLNDGSDSI